MNYICRICDNKKDNKFYKAKEMGENTHKISLLDLRGLKDLNIWLIEK